MQMLLHLRASMRPALAVQSEGGFLGIDAVGKLIGAPDEPYFEGRGEDCLERVRFRRGGVDDAQKYDSDQAEPLQSLHLVTENVPM